MIIRPPQLGQVAAPGSSCGGLMIMIEAIAKAAFVRPQAKAPPQARGSNSP